MRLPSRGTGRQSRICAARLQQLRGWLWNARRGRRRDTNHRSAARADGPIGLMQLHVLLPQRHRFLPPTGEMLPSVVGAQAAYMMSVRSVPERASGKRARTEGPVAGTCLASPKAASRSELRRGRADPARRWIVPFPLSVGGSSVRGQTDRIARRRNSVPSSHIQCSTPPIRCATATVVRFKPRGLWQPGCPMPWARMASRGASSQ